MSSFVQNISFPGCTEGDRSAQSARGWTAIVPRGACPHVLLAYLQYLVLKYCETHCLHYHQPTTIISNFKRRPVSWFATIHAYQLLSLGRGLGVQEPHRLARSRGEDFDRKTQRSRRRCKSEGMCALRFCVLCCWWNWCRMLLNIIYLHVYHLHARLDCRVSTTTRDCDHRRLTYRSRLTKSRKNTRSRFRSQKQRFNR